jgi:hypothetical protein
VEGVVGELWFVNYISCLKKRKNTDASKKKDDADRL